MLIRISTTIAAISMLFGAAFAQGAGKLTDPQIADIVQTFDRLDIEDAKLAVAKSTNRTVRAFAEKMLRERADVHEQARRFVQKLNITPEANDISRSLNDRAAEKRAELSRLSGADFDKAYLANEIAYQITLNGALEVTLIPSAANPELKRLMQARLRVLQGHQQRTKELADTVK